LLVALETLIALNAIGGGIYGLAGAKSVPRAWLAGSPFHSYLIPSLVLLLIVGGVMIVALGLTAVGARRAAEAPIAAGLVLLGWITVEALIIPFSWLQPTFLVLAIAVVKLAYLERLQIAGRPRRVAHQGER
jgi:hypothetical protein